MRAIAYLMLALGPVTVAHSQVCTADQDQQFDSCTGEFYDSGGVGGNYGNNEDVTVTICPDGGAGSGPFTSVRFITWALAGGPPPGDRLEIFDGTTNAGAPLAVGTSGNSLAGLTFTSSDASGCLTFRFRSDVGGTSAGWFARIVTTPWPGTNGAQTVCSNGASFSMFGFLGNSPDAGGSWTAPGGGAHSGSFNPATDPSGIYTYTHAGAVPCPDVSATVTVTKVQVPNAGINGNATFCTTSSAAQLINFLGGSPDGGGTWTGPNGAHSGNFNPASDPAGTYTYTVSGTAPCANASANVIVTVNQPANAGTSGGTSVCSNSAAFQLFDLLGGNPQPTGAWTGPSNTPVVGTYTPGTSAPGVYTYTVPGAPPCPAALSTVTVLQTTAPNAGQSRSITVCSDDAAFSMRGQLLGTPDLGGTWVGPLGAHGDLFNPTTDPAGAYVYTVAGTGPCANASATLTITVNQRPNAGMNGSVTLCSTDANFNLFGALGGTPQVGGVWRDPSNNVHSGTFVPGTSAIGNYTYTVTGLAPCAPSSATVNVSVNTAPRAGNGTGITVCSNNSTFSLFALLTGNPDNNGTWSGPLGAHSGTLNPSSDPSGVYTYTVLGVFPCANATASINVTVNPAPNAGINGSHTVCGNSAAFNLIDHLGGTPWLTGTWTAPGGGASAGVFTPGSSVAGTYTYTANGLSPCAPAIATVNVTVIAPPNPGTNGSITVCSSDGPVNLFTLLGGSPETGGTWVGPGGAHSGTYLPGSQVGGNYTYTVAGNSPCGPLSAVVQVNRVIAPRAGTDGVTTVCSTNPAFDMITVLGGNPNGGGTWINALNQAVSATFTPGTTAPGVYRYVVNGTAPCVNDTAQATVNVNQAPNAGSNGNALVCSNDAPFNLINFLGGNPDGGGSWTRPNGTSHSGTFTPGTSQPGGYTYTVQGQTPCPNASAVVSVSVTQAPNAGIGGDLTRCSNQGQVNLFMQLSGNPSNGGSWTGPNGAHSGFLNPASDPSGAYVYTVNGLAPCANATATINVTINAAPNAGSDGSITICQGTASVDLFTVIGGPFDLNGTWTEMGTPTGQLSGNFFLSASMPPGTYQFRYEVPGIGSCAADHAHATVVIVALLNAGTSGNLAACSSNTQVNLFNGLGGNPQPGGQWIDLNSTNAINGNLFNATLVVAPGIYQFRYRLTGALSCSADSAMVTVNVTAAANPGCNSNALFCSTVSTPQNLFAFLNCNPQSGGQWRRNSPGGPTFSGQYTPTIDSPATFYYVFNQGPPCSTVFATVTVDEVPGPNAGFPNSVQRCSSDSPFNMTAALNGTPDLGGQWYFGIVPHSSTFTPGLDPQGVYEYRVTGISPCLDASASLTVSVTPEANAGCNSSFLACSNQPQFLLFPLLTCNPNSNGFWLDPNLNPLPSGAYTPGSSQQGDYRYIVVGQSPCTSDTAIVSVFETPAPNAGCAGSASLCASLGAPAVNLFNFLNCTPDPFGTWSGPGPLNPPGFFTPGTSVPGLYTYTVANSCGSVSSNVNVVVGSPGNAGCNAAMQWCNTSGAFNMFLYLGCSPALGGTWSGPLPSTAVVSGLFTPGVSVPGTYRYSVPGTGGCSVATATLTVTIVPFKEAGVNANLPICSTAGSVDLFPLLGPTAQPGGTWYFNSATQHTGILVPSSDQSGSYVYRHAANGPCLADSAIVSVTIYAPRNAGCDGVLNVCSNSGAVILFNSLGCNPETQGGSWFRPNGQPFTGLFDPQVDVSGVYKYKLPGNNGCGPDSSYVTVFLFPEADAGATNPLPHAVCSNSPEFQLASLLLGSPQQDGTWFDPNNVVFSGTFTPGTSLPGTYKYRVVGLGPCLSDSAFVTVSVSQQANAGITQLSDQCSSGAPVPLISLLGGLPDPGGSWVGPSPVINGLFDPATMNPGLYTYTVQGTAPCGPASASVFITIIPQAYAGTGGAITACEGATEIQLFDALSDAWTPGGTWINGCGIGTINNGVYDASLLVAGQGCGFTYSHPSNGPCPAMFASVSLNIVTALDAGVDASVQICRGTTPVLFDLLGGAPQPGGYWQNIDNAPGFNALGFFQTGQVPANSTWRFDYIHPSLPQCPGDTARVTVTVINGPFAGNNGSLPVCSNSFPVNLGLGLGPGADAGGIWYNSVWQVVPALFTPSSGSGLYHYVVAGNGACPADSADVNVTVIPAPNAGDGLGVSICSIDAPVALFGLLGPNAQAGGTWTFTPAIGGTPVPHSGTYVPAVDDPGSYTYRVAGAPPCADAIATVTVSEPQVPNAGCDATAALCTNGSAVIMRTLLGCNAQPGGTWVYVTGGNTPQGLFVNPAVDPPGVYRYTIVGDSPCPSASAELTLSVNPATNAGQGSTINRCVTETAVDLFATLGPSAQAGGTWTDNNNSGALSGNIFNPSVAGNGNWGFTYTVTGITPCLSSSANVTVQVGTGGNAGSDSTVAICGSLAQYNLFNALGGNPQQGGTWAEATGVPVGSNGILDPSLLTIGQTYAFSYSINDPDCGLVTAIITLTAAPFPVAGTGSSLTLCSNSAAIDLFSQLTGNPDVDGSWTDPNGLAHGDSFIPGTHAPGNYTYTVAGEEPCANVTAVVSIAVNTPPDAGLNGSLLACDTLQALVLFTGLQGTPQAGGSWQDIDGTGGLSGGVLNTTGIAPGNYVFRYSVSITGCAPTTADVTVQVVGGVEVNDVQRECITRDRTYVVRFTISEGDAGTYEVNGLQGAITAAAPYIFTSEPLFTSQEFEAFVRDQYGCALIRVAGNSPCDFTSEVFVPESFSPNGDGVNDALIIPGIEGFPGNRISIFNRWGAKLYETEGYDNKSVLWDGSTAQGQAPASTYFYVLELGEGRDALTGFIYLNR